MENIYYVYVYLDQRKPGIYSYLNYKFEYEPFYIGKGVGNRENHHLTPYNLRKFCYKNNKIKKIIKETGEQPIHYRIEKNLSENDAYSLETLLITTIGRENINTGPLTNLTDGSAGCKNRVITEKFREQMREANLGKRRSEEAKSNMSKSQTGKVKSLKSIEKMRFKMMKAVIYYDSQMNILGKFASLGEAAKAIDYSIGMVSKCCKYYRNIYNGNTFRYEGDDTAWKPSKIMKKKPIKINN